MIKCVQLLGCLLMFLTTDYPTGDGHDGGKQLEPDNHSEAGEPADGGATAGLVLTQ